jgi:DNA-binding beta-propeller fold protein YncE
MVAVGGLAIALAGCAVKQPQFTELLWPEAPLTPRIKFLRLLRTQDDLGKSTGERFAAALVGPGGPSIVMQRPMGIAASHDGKRLYVSDYDRGRVVVFDFETRRVEPVGGAHRGFKRPFGVAVDDNDNLYVVDSSEGHIRVFDAQGTFLRNITHESLERPTGIAVDTPRQRIYVADSSRKGSDNHFVHVFDLDGIHIKVLGGLGKQEGEFFFPTYVTVDREGNLYVTDTLNSRVQVFDPDGHYIRELGKHGDGFGMFHKPKGVALDSFGNTYVVDSVWSNVQIFNTRGEVLLYFAGRGRIPGLLNNPTGITIDKDNRIYVADAFNSRVAVYQLINTTAEDSFLVSPPAKEREGEPSTGVQKKRGPEKTTDRTSQPVREERG